MHPQLLPIQLYKSCLMVPESNRPVQLGKGKLSLGTEMEQEAVSGAVTPAQGASGTWDLRHFRNHLSCMENTGTRKQPRRSLLKTPLKGEERSTSSMFLHVHF